MQTSSEITELAKALVQFHDLVGKIAKTEKNPFFNSRYASLTTILGAIKEPLQESGLVVIQLPCGVYQLTTRLLHESGQWLEETYTMQPTKTAEKKGQPVEDWQVTPQTIGSAITYQRRYAIVSLLCLNIDEDDDGNRASRPPEHPATPPKSEEVF